MTQISIAVVVQDSAVIDVVIQGWPRDLPAPSIVTVDFDSDGAKEDDLYCLAEPDGYKVVAEAVCAKQVPTLYEDSPICVSPYEILNKIQMRHDSDDDD